MARMSRASVRRRASTMCALGCASRARKSVYPPKTSSALPRSSIGSRITLTRLRGAFAKGLAASGWHTAMAMRLARQRERLGRRSHGPTSRRAKSANFRRMQCSKHACLFDHLVRTGKERRGDGEAERLRSLRVDTARSWWPAEPAGLAGIAWRAAGATI